MQHTTWQLQIPINAVVFDCDGTLSAIEGIDELARSNGVQEQVRALTHQAMSQTGINAQLYQQRLALVYPSREQVIALGKQYYMNLTPDAHSVIDVLKRLNKSLYLASAGLYPAVSVLGELLGIPVENIFAVEIDFDAAGNFIRFNEKSPLIKNDGKRSIIEQLKKTHQHIIHIGDGLNDCVTRDIVTRFVGYGGAFYRKHIAKLCPYYINTPSLSPFLPLTLTPSEFETLTPLEKSLYIKGMDAITRGKVKLANPDILD